MTNKNDALPVVAWEFRWMCDSEFSSCSKQEYVDVILNVEMQGRQLCDWQLAHELLATRDAELADLRAVSDACSNSLADKCREVVQLQAELAALRDFVLHVKKCITKNGEYAPLSTQSIDEALGLSPTDAAPLVSANSEFGDAYQGAREDLAIWKKRALEAEAALREEQILTGRQEPCAICAGDCAGANPPINDCPLYAAPLVSDKAGAVGTLCGKCGEKLYVRDVCTVYCRTCGKSAALNPLAADVAQGGGEKP